MLSVLVVDDVPEDAEHAIACPPILEMEITGFGRSSILNLKLLCCTPRASWPRLRAPTELRCGLENRAGPVESLGAARRAPPS